MRVDLPVPAAPVMMFITPGLSSTSRRSPDTLRKKMLEIFQRVIP
jgi:hypothetical protein